MNFLHAPLNPDTGKRNHEPGNLQNEEKALSSECSQKGGLVVEQGSGGRLKERSPGGLDVLCQEPMRRKILSLPSGTAKLIVTPHMAWAPVRNRERLMRCVYRNIEEIK